MPINQRELSFRSAEKSLKQSRFWTLVGPQFPQTGTRLRSADAVFASAKPRRVSQCFAVCWERETLYGNFAWPPHWRGDNPMAQPAVTWVGQRPTDLLLG